MASASERRALRALARASFRPGSDEALRCEIGRAVSPNSVLEAAVIRGGQQIQLGLLSAESQCRTHDVYAAWDPRDPGRSVARVVAKLLASIRRPEIELPAAAQPVRAAVEPAPIPAEPAPIPAEVPQPAPAATRLDHLISRAEARLPPETEPETETEPREPVDPSLLQEDWRRVRSLVVRTQLPPPERIELLEEYLRGSFPEDAYAPAARRLLAALKAKREPLEVLGMIKVPGGRFRIGCRSNKDVGCRKDERPSQEAHLPTFYIDRTEVTIEAYRACVEAGVCKPPKYLPTHPDLPPLAAKECNYAHPKRAGHPVNCVSSEDAEGFCAFMGKRLPTELEWEKAARGTDGRLYPWGNHKPTCDLVHFYDRKQRRGCGLERSTRAKSGRKGASPYGVVHMAGNLDEWTATAPSGRSESRWVKGGNWVLDENWMRPSRRSSVPASLRSSTIGFRCASS
ncbi:MAG: SUMF1/EgtB/PvdO family nonheme iron enzyme [Myxococcota bacterium]